MHTHTHTHTLSVCFCLLPPATAACSSYWGVLLLYSTAVVLLQFVWGFYFTHGGQEPTLDTIGLSEDAHDTFYDSAAFNVFILALCIVQHYINAYTRTNAGLARRFARHVGRAGLRVLINGWGLFVLLVLVLSGMLGERVTLIKLGYVMCFCLNTIATSSDLIHELSWYLTATFAAVIVVAKYIVQFERVEADLRDAITADWMDDIGLDRRESIQHRFTYLVGRGKWRLVESESESEGERERERERESVCVCVCVLVCVCMRVFVCVCVHARVCV